MEDVSRVELTANGVPDGNYIRLDSWLSGSFRLRNCPLIDKDEKIRLLDAIQAGPLASTFPKYGGDFSEEQRIQFQRLVKDTLGIDRFLKMGPHGITKNAELFGLPTRNWKEPLVIFNCAKCNQKYEAPVEMADTLLECQNCQQPIKVPRPDLGSYASPTESQLEDADLYEIRNAASMFRGQLRDLLAKTGSDPTKQPSEAKWAEHGRRRAIRQGRLEEYEKMLADMAEEKRKDAELEKRLGREERYEECFMEIFGKYYHKPTKVQFEAVYDWLDQNRPNWNNVTEPVDDDEIATDILTVGEAMGILYPELRKKAARSH